MGAIATQDSRAPYRLSGTPHGAMLSFANRLVIAPMGRSYKVAGDAPMRHEHAWAVISAGGTVLPC
jgi:hypothetical protein